MFQIELKNKEYNEAVKNRLIELGWKNGTVDVERMESLSYTHLHVDNEGIHANSIPSSKRNEGYVDIFLNDLYTNPDKYRYKKKVKKKVKKKFSSYFFKAIDNYCAEESPYFETEKDFFTWLSADKFEKEDLDFYRVLTVQEVEYEES